jgi:CRISPR type I-E-associated protein CasB/Cse2
VTATEQFVSVLTRLKAGDLALLRSHADEGIDESVAAFDLFAGIWWPLRERSERAPRREVAWLVAKLFAACPMPHSPKRTLAIQLRRCQPGDEGKRRQFREEFDRMLSLSLREIEPALRFSLGRIASGDRQVDWVRLTDDLSRWEREATRLAWARQFLGIDDGG